MTELVPGADAEDLVLLEKEKQVAIKAIKKLELRVTPAEVAAQTDLPTDKASFWLNKIASETRGALQVTEDGSIYYSFSPRFTDTYLQTGIKKTMLTIGTTLLACLYWIMRMSFGVVLLVSILVIILIFVALIVVSIAAIFGDDSGGFDLDFGDLGGGFFRLDFLFDIFYYSYSPSHSHYPNSRPSPRREKYASFVDEHPKGNFFLECFSFLFGDGNPNSNMETIRWQQIARVIQKNGGVVSTEQLAPYLDGDRSDAGMVLSALAQFNGRPEVTRSGYIVYIFPDFLDVNAMPLREELNVEFTDYLKEDEWKFSAFPAKAQLTVLCLAIFNFVGSWWLFSQITSIDFLNHISYVIDFLFVYACMFLLIPVVRLIVITWLNSRIEKRNARRLTAFRLIEHPQDDVLEELQEAEEIRKREVASLCSNKSIVFDSDKDSLAQQFPNEPE